MKKNDHDLLICDPRSEEEKKIMKINNRFIADASCTFLGGHLVC